MTLKELKDKYKDLPDDTELAICMPDGNLDYTMLNWFDADQKVIVISGN